MYFNRRTIRLENFDYSNNGYYFVTICAQNRKNIFGEIVGARRDSPLIDNKLSLINKNNNLSKMKLNSNGKIIKFVWKTLPDHYDVILDEFCIMPNHIHFILGIKNNLNENNNGVLENNNGVLENNTKGASRRAPTRLGFVIGMFKTECAKRINKLNETLGIQIFQRNYYEHIIRNEKEYLRTKKYIKLNPEMWYRDRNNFSKTLP
jgi:REP element-mobilizing transposase RayT